LYGAFVTTGPGAFVATGLYGAFVTPVDAFVTSGLGDFGAVVGALYGVESGLAEG